MPKTQNKLDKRKSIIRPVHLQTIIFIIVYFVLSNLLFIGSVAHSNLFISFFIPLIFGLGTTFIFLYLFSHRDFFDFIGNLEIDEKKNEKKYLDRFKRYGKLIACILIGAVGGPIFLALTIRFLFAESENRYWIAFISMLISTIIVVAFAKGLIRFII